jgi:hypothetical protein
VAVGWVTTAIWLGVGVGKSRDGVAVRLARVSLLRVAAGVGVQLASRGGALPTPRATYAAFSELIAPPVE